MQTVNGGRTGLRSRRPRQRLRNAKLGTKGLASPETCIFATEHGARGLLQPLPATTGRPRIVGRDSFVVVAQGCV